MIANLRPSPKIAFILAPALLAASFFFAFPALYLSNISVRLSIPTLDRSAVRLVNYYFKNGYKYGCHDIDYYGFQGGFSVVVPIYLPEKENLLMVEPNLDAIYFYIPDIVNQTTEEMKETMAVHNTLVFNSCGI